MSTALATLTEIEVLGLNSQHNMADGHAYHDLAPQQLAIVNRLPELWKKSAAKKHGQAEEDFRNAFLSLAACPSLSNYPHFRICPTASNSIDTVASWLKENNLKTLLIEPTFDNLSLILKRRGVPIASIAENDVIPMVHGQCTHDFDALFLVNPNNPTGKNLTEQEFKHIVHWCKENGKIVLLDNTFRFFVPQLYDTYSILQESQVTFISIEDTGKVWPTQDLKVSLIFFSENIAKEMNQIYEEIYLCVSNFQLEILSLFLLDAKNRGLDVAVWQEVAFRRNAFRKVIQNSPLEIHPVSVDSKISVEWVTIKNGYGDDFSVLNFFQQNGLVVLPGRHFYWDANGPHIPLNSLRFSLLKTRDKFFQGLAVLDSTLKKMK
jgi:aspartate/methionine/tyrosine aminotransferase